jgi:hypothetical protein
MQEVQQRIPLDARGDQGKSPTSAGRLIGMRPPIAERPFGSLNFAGDLLPRQATLMQLRRAVDDRDPPPMFGLAARLLTAFPASVARITTDRPPTREKLGTQPHGRWRR